MSRRIQRLRLVTGNRIQKKHHTHMKKLSTSIFLGLLLVLWAPLVSVSQTFCDPAIAPTNLSSTYTLGTGALLTWDAVPGSVGVRLKAVLPGGTNVSKTIVGTEPSLFMVPDASLSPGVYTWQVQATCNLVPPYLTTAVSALDTFAVGGVVTCPATVTDIDGNVYPTVALGGQCWIQSNLQTTHYQNGDLIPTGLLSYTWQNTTTGAYAVLDNNPANKAIYGLLYNQYTVADSRGLCPTGWHVPSTVEWNEATSFLGGAGPAGGAMKQAGTSLWQAPNAGATNSSGLTILPSGFRDDTGPYSGKGQYAYLWTSTILTGYLADYTSFGYLSNFIYVNHTSRPDGFAVRCIQD